MKRLMAVIFMAIVCCSCTSLPRWSQYAEVGAYVDGLSKKGVDIDIIKYPDIVENTLYITTCGKITDGTDSDIHRALVIYQKILSFESMKNAKLHIVSDWPYVDVNPVDLEHVTYLLEEESYERPTKSLLDYMYNRKLDPEDCWIEAGLFCSRYTEPYPGMTKEQCDFREYDMTIPGLADYLVREYNDYRLIEDFDRAELEWAKFKSPYIDRTGLTIEHLRNMYTYAKENTEAMVDDSGPEGGWECDFPHVDVEVKLDFEVNRIRDEYAGTKIDKPIAMRVVLTTYGVCDTSRPKEREGLIFYVYTPVNGEWVLSHSEMK